MPAKPTFIVMMVPALAKALSPGCFRDAGAPQISSGDIFGRI
jgi:hypothetical protein